MGLIRKVTSISTLGVVKYRSDGEQARLIAKQTRNAARANVVQNEVLIEQARQQQEIQLQALQMQKMQVAAQLAEAHRRAAEEQAAQFQLQQQSPQLQASQNAILTGESGHASISVQPGWYPLAEKPGHECFWDGTAWVLETLRPKTS